MDLANDIWYLLKIEQLAIHVKSKNKRLKINSINRTKYHEVKSLQLGTIKKKIKNI